MANVIVSSCDFLDVIALLSNKKFLSLDTETTGVRVYHQDRLFSIAMSDGENSYYFNFNFYPITEMSWTYHLPQSWIKSRMLDLFEKRDITWFLHNAKFDLGMLAKEGVTVKGTIHCTQAIARLEDNTHLKYSLDVCAKRIGLTKDDKVEEYIKANKLYDWEVVPGKKQRTKLKHFDKVPFEIISQYACQDALVTYQLGMHQIKALTDFSNTLPNGKPTPLNVMANERLFTKTCFEIEQRGVLIDKEYCTKASQFEKEVMVKSSQEFERLTGTSFVNSAKVLGPIFKRLGEDFPKTELGNDSFTKDVLDGFKSREAELVREFRKAEKRSAYFNSYLYYADTNGVVHANIKQGGTEHGRVSYSDPNFQNVSKRGEEKSEFPIRRAIIPRPGYFFYELDYRAAEYRLMVDYSGQMDLIEMIKNGHDVHTACMELMNLDKRDKAKTMNFLKLYCGGAQKLANALGISLSEARRLSDKYWERLPYVAQFIKDVSYTAKTRGYIINWLGRVCRFPKPEFSYIAPNHLISGGSADISKVAMNKLHVLLSNKLSKMLIQVHDSLLFEIHDSEEYLMPQIKNIMETVYPHKHLPMLCDEGISRKSWWDME